MTIDEAIRQILDSVLKNKTIYLFYEDRVALCRALNIMRKYQKIEQLIADYENEEWEQIAVYRIREIIDGKID